MKLAAFQEGMQVAILTGDVGILPALVETARFDRAARFGIYFNAYRLRLAEVISKDYPMLREAMGDDDFEALAIDYIGQTRSRHSNARWYASNLPEFMAGHPRWRHEESWIDLARMERALADAFDAAEAPQFDADALSTIEPKKVSSMRIELHPSVRLLDLRTGALDAYAAAAEQRRRPAARKSREHIVVWRLNERCRYRALEEDEKLALAEARDGRSFGEICATLAYCNPDGVAQRAANILLQWFNDGFVSAICVVE